MLESQGRRYEQRPDNTFAGAITAALFLKRFVYKATSWAHLDFAWNPSPRPGRPGGGESQ